jgi:hypothetical protein
MAGKIPLEEIPSLNQLFHDIVNLGNIELVEWLLFGFILVGVIIKLFTFNLHTTVTPEQSEMGYNAIGPATGTIWGYSIILFAAIGLVFISVNPQKENMEQLKGVPISLFAIVILLLWSIILNFRYYDKINTTINMPYKYEQWNTWSLVTIIILSIFAILEYIIYNLQNTSYDGLISHIKVYTIVVFFAGIVVLGIQDSILNNFLVDG